MMKKRINPVVKGRRNEAKCRDALKEAGYCTWKTFRGKYQNLDMFGLFDVVGLSPDGSHLVFVQVKSNSCAKKVRDKIREFKMPDCCRKMVWIWVDRKGWKKEWL